MTGHQITGSLGVVKERDNFAGEQTIVAQIVLDVAPRAKISALAE
jgi:hypothetical protein